MAVGSTYSSAETITIAVGGHVDKLDPHHATSFSEIVISQTLHRGLVEFDFSGNVIPGLAERWDISSDGRTYLFFLRPDLKWSDNRLLTANHIVSGFKRTLDPNRPSPFAAKLFMIRNAEEFYSATLKDGEALGVNSPNPQTVVFHLNSRNVDFLETLAHPIATPFPGSNEKERYGQWAESRLTSGAYRVSSRHEAGGLTLEPVGAGHTLLIQPVRSTQGAKSLASKKEMFVTAAIPIVVAPTMGDRTDWVHADESEALYAYGFNMSRKPFNTLEIRHALAMAVNRNFLLEALPTGIGVHADHLVSQSLMGGLGSYKAPFTTLTFEEREAVAEALLAEQGFSRDKPLYLTLRIPEGDIHRKAANRITAMWADSGIEAEIIESALPEHWQSLERGDYDVAYMAWPRRYGSPLDILEPLSQAGGPWNFPRYDFMGLTERLERAAFYKDQEVRLAHYREAEKVLIEDQVLIALFFYSPLSIVSSSVRGWRPNTAGLQSLAGLTVVKKQPLSELIRPILQETVPTFGGMP
ncbi:MAG: peptide ABC transporter substrate-binding protein [Rhodospirillaceae bacterium]